MSDGNLDIPEEKIKSDANKAFKKSINLPGEYIDKLKSRREENLVVSFEFFTRKDELFCLDGAETKNFVDLIDKLQMLTEINVEEFFGSERDKFNPSKYSYDDFDCEIPIENTETLEQYDFIKFRIRKKPRILSVIIGNVVYIVLIDFYHNLHLTDRYPNFERHDHLLTYEERLENRIKGLEETVDVLKEEKLKAESDLEEFLAGEECKLCGNDKVKSLAGYICDNCTDEILN